MKIPRCAAPWLVVIAKNLVQAGSENPGIPNLAWIQNWKVALHWMQTPTFSVLAYYSEGNFDEAMQMQLLDAFSRCSRKRLVSIVNETEISALCFFGGAPPSVQLPTLDFKAMDELRKSIPRH